MKYYTTVEVAEIIKESPDTVRRRCATGQLRAKNIGGRWRVSENDLTEFMSGPPTRSPRKRLTKRQREQLGTAS